MATSPAPSDSVAPSDLAASAAAAGPTPVLVHRPVRAFPRPLPATELKLAAPPAVGWAASNLAAWLQYLVPLVGSGGSIGFLFAVPGPRPVWLVVLVTGLAGASVLAGLGLRLVEHRATGRARHRERSRYLAHLRQVAAAADHLAAAQLAVAEHLHPDPPALWSTVTGTDRLWERRPADPDFLTVRVGRGPVPLATPVRLDLPVDPLLEHDPGLLQAAEEIARRAARLPGAPVAVPLRDLGVLALTGPPDRVRSLARSLVCELAAFHAPDDLRILADHPAWGWTLRLPHAGPATGTGHRDTHGRDPTATPGRPVAGPLAESRARPDGRPHLVAIVDTTDPGAGASAAEGTAPPGWAGRGTTAEDLLERSAAAGVTVIWLAATTSDEPSELSMRVRVDDQGAATLQETIPGGQFVGGIRADAADLARCSALARRLAPLRLDRPSPSAARTSPAGPVDLLDLLDLPTGLRNLHTGGGRAGPTDSSTGPANSRTGPIVRGAAAVGPGTGGVGRGRGVPARPRSELLRVPVGVTPSGDPVVLDLKEAAEQGIGPHGLVIGATGSGKSELLRTIVAGLAATHPPEQLALVLVDFKGGAAFADLTPLPHVAGLITNLQADLSMVDRAMAALQGELARRQRLLRRSGNQPDLRAYTMRREADPRLEPLPQLLLVVDELGELLAARPELLDLFTAIGRVGRSLGMHLLLASQRLDEGQLRGLDSHLRFRICLRTFSAAESIAVLGVPDAYHLPPAPGSALVKVDASPPVPFTAACISGAGHRPDLRTLIAGLAGAGQPVHQVWLPSLPAEIALEPLLRRTGPGWLQVPVGLVDRPLDQAQEPLVLDLSGSAGHLAVVGAPRSGKSTLLCGIVAALAAAHPPDEVQVYAVDLGGGLLHRLGDLPHLGAVCGARETERVHHLVRALRSLVFERERRFRELGVDSMAAWHRLRRAGLDPGGHGEVFLLVDNWGALVRGLPELEADITELAGVGLHYGVHLVLAANRWAELRPGLRENLGGRLELRLNDPLESELGRLKAAGLPRLPGRGLTPDGLQFQAALPGPPSTVLARSRSSPDGAAAPPLRLLPRLVEEQVLSAPDHTAAGARPADPAGRPAEPENRWAQQEDQPGERAARSGEPETTPGHAAGVPFALEEHHLDLVHLDLFGGSPHLLVLGDAECGKSSLLRLVARQLAARHPPDEVALLVVDLRRGLLDLATLPNVIGYAWTTAGIAQAVEHLHRELTERTPAGVDLPPGLLTGPWPPGSSTVPGAQRNGPPAIPPPAAGPILHRSPATPVPTGRGLNGSWAPHAPAGPNLNGSRAFHAPAGPSLNGSRATQGPAWVVGGLDGDPRPGPAALPDRVGRRYVVLVDDYDLLPAAAGSPLLPLLDLLGLGRELGLHLVLARRVAGAARAGFEPVFQRLRELGGPGLVMSGDPGEGPLLGGQKAVPLPPGRGFLVQPRRPPTLVQVAYSPRPVAPHPAGADNRPAVPDGVADRDPDEQDREGRVGER